MTDPSSREPSLKNQLIAVVMSVEFISNNGLRMKRREPSDSPFTLDYYDKAVEMAAAFIVNNQRAISVFAQTNPDFAHHLIRAVQRDDKFGSALMNKASPVVQSAFQVAYDRPGVSPRDEAGNRGTPGPNIFVSPIDSGPEWSL